MPHQGLCYLQCRCQINVQAATNRHRLQSTCRAHDASTLTCMQWLPAHLSALHVLIYIEHIPTLSRASPGSTSNSCSARWEMVWMPLCRMPRLSSYCFTEASSRATAEASSPAKRDLLFVDCQGKRSELLLYISEQGVSWCW